MSDTASTRPEGGGAGGEDAALAELLHRAREYPYAAPAHSYIYTADGIRAFDPAACAGRTPVLAVGSNRAPERLYQKFGHAAAHTIPVQRARLDHFDVVYAAHIAGYGAVPAMLQSSPGTRVEIWVTWLDDAQLGIMHETEIGTAHYRYARLPGVRLQMADGTLARTAYAYVSQRGHMLHEGRALALAAVPAERRRFPAASTAEALEIVRHRMGATDHDPDGFVARLVRDPDYRARVTETLSATAVAFQHRYEILA